MICALFNLLLCVDKLSVQLFATAVYIIYIMRHLYEYFSYYVILICFYPSIPEKSQKLFLSHFWGHILLCPYCFSFNTGHFERSFF